MHKLHKLHKAQMDTPAEPQQIDNHRHPIKPQSNCAQHGHAVAYHYGTNPILHASFEYPYAINSSSNQKDLTWGRTDGFSNVLQL